MYKAVAASIGKNNLDSILLDILKYIVRVKHQDGYKVDFKSMRALFDASLARQYQRLKTAGVQVSTCLSTHFETASLIMDRSDLTAIVAAEGSWAEAAPQVARLAGGSQLGATVFGYAGMLVNSEAYRAEIDQLFSALFEGDFNMDDVATFKSD